MATAEDVQNVSYQNYNVTMNALNNSLVTTQELLNKVAIKKFDEVQAEEAKGVQAVLASDPKQGPTQQ